MLRTIALATLCATASLEEAVLSMDLRLVPDQTPAGVREKIEVFLRERGWTIVENEPDPAFRRSDPRIIRLEWEPGHPALRPDLSSPAAEAVIAVAARAAHRHLAVMP